MEVYFVLDDRGEAIPVDDVEAWSRWFERADRGVARTVVSPEVAVLTTFNGYDAPEEGRPPMPFATHVLGGILDGEEVRHTTRNEALAAHAALVEWCKIGNSPDHGITPEQIE